MHERPRRSLFVPKFLLTTAFCLCPFASPAEADTQSADLKPNRILRTADLAVYGEVVAKQSAWEGKKIITTYQIHVISVAKGDYSEDEISLRVLGGEVKTPFPIAMHVPGSPILAIGDQVLTFLKKDTATGYRIVGTNALLVRAASEDRRLVRMPDGRSIPVDKALRRIEELHQAIEEEKKKRQEASQVDDR